MQVPGTGRDLHAYLCVWTRMPLPHARPLQLLPDFCPYFYATGDRSHLFLSKTCPVLPESPTAEANQATANQLRAFHLLVPGQGSISGDLCGDQLRVDQGSERLRESRSLLTPVLC